MVKRSLYRSWFEYITHNDHYLYPPSGEAYVNGMKLAMNMEFKNPKKTIKKITKNGKKLCAFDCEKKKKKKIKKKKIKQRRTKKKKKELIIKK